MAHFAQIGADNVVLRVVVINNSDIMKNGEEDEQTGLAFCRSLFGQNTHWVQTSYNGKFRGCYAGIGYTYNSAADIFVPPQSAGA